MVTTISSSAITSIINFLNIEVKEHIDKVVNKYCELHPFIGPVIPTLISRRYDIDFDGIILYVEYRFSDSPKMYELSWDLFTCLNYEDVIKRDIDKQVEKIRKIREEKVRKEEEEIEKRDRKIYEELKKKFELQ